jgi:AcrR family transcriptional regulator
MGISERKERDRTAMRTAILAAARDMLERGGYEAVTIRSIADRIEYSPRSIYLYFSDKGAVLNELRAAGFAELTEAMGRVSAVDALGRLKSYATTYLAFASAHGSLYRLMFEKPLDIPVDEARADWPSFSLLVDCLDACLREAGLASDDGAARGPGGSEHPASGGTALIAAGFWSLVHGVASLSETRILAEVGEFGAEAIVLGFLERFLKRNSSSKENI